MLTHGKPARAGRQGGFQWLHFVAAAWLCLCLCTGLTLQTLAAAQAEPLVKVGYDVTGVLLRKTDQGIYRGYNVEFLYEIAKYTGWNYQFVPYNTWDGALKALAAGEIDILPTVLKSPQREKEMLFANHWMGMIHVALVVPADDRTHFYGDLASLQGMRVGVRRNTKDAADVEKWAREVGLKYQLVVYGDNKELLEALDAGKIDAAGLSYIGRARKYRAIMEFAPQEMYFAVAPQKPQIKLQLDSALGQIAALNPEFYADAMEKLTGRETNPLPVFSQKENAFINDGKPVRITFLKQAAPFSYVDDSGAYQGLLPKLLTRITALSGLKFTYVVVENPAAALKAVQEGRADVVGRITNNLFFARQEHLRLTTPYTYLPLVQVTRPETQTVARVGMQEHCQMDLIQDQECAEKKGKSSQGAATAEADKDFQLYPTPDALFQALQDGKIDAIYCDAVTAGHLMELHGTTKFKQTVLQPFTYSFTLGVGPKADPLLAGILDKSIRCISVKEVEEMFIQSRVERTATVKGLLERMPMAYVAGFTIFLLALIAGLVAALILLRRQSREKMAVMEQAAATKQDKLRMEALEKNVEEKNRFFANISHDMRTPLNAIIGLSLLARSEQVSAKVKDYLDKIQASGNLLLGLINDTLNISKLSSGKVILKNEPVACAQIFEDVVVPIREAAAAKKLQFTADRSGLTCDYLLTDRLNLEKILLNLLTNAIKYTPAGGQVQFTLASAQESGQHFLVVTVRDNGIGIAPVFLPHLYDAFAQEDDANAGTGLGMAIVKRLVELMAGTIQVDSPKEQGTTFTVRLPLQAVAAPDQAAAAAVVSPERLAKLAGRKILLCEDNELNRQIATALLQKQGLEVVTAENGRQGLDIFSASAEQEFALVLMDVRMPVMDGLTATAAIRSLNRRDADVPIVAMTANTFPEDIQACLNVGMNGHVAKPVDPNHLYETLLQALQL
jgi:signal transduction histidine kinase/ABC-type amino acid transport substrate-binding protein/CheY-like chemotaxis protein